MSCTMQHLELGPSLYGSSFANPSVPAALTKGWQSQSLSVRFVYPSRTRNEFLCRYMGTLTGPSTGLCTFLTDNPPLPHPPPMKTKTKTEGFRAMAARWGPRAFDNNTNHLPLTRHGRGPEHLTVILTIYH